MSKILKTKDDVDCFLKESNVTYKEYKHKPALTIDDLKNDPGKFDQSSFVKNLLFKDKNGLYFFILDGDTQINDNFWPFIGSSKNKKKFAREDDLNKFHAIKGSVSVFNVLNDIDGLIVKLIIDEKLENETHWNFHPQSNEYSYEISKNDVLKLLAERNKTPNFMDVTKAKEKVEEKKPKKENKKGETKLKIENKKEKNFSDWYQEIIIKADLINYYNVSGCYILKPDSYFMWEQIQNDLDQKIKKIGVRNVYFPMFVSQQNLEKEKNHVEGFQAEVAWVTQYGNSDLKEKIAIRPTSETIMYPSFSDWVHSYRDLPIKINQWTNIVRWEFKHPTPFIRTREFLWQEGHTAHETKQESSDFVFSILDIYESCYRDLLLVPVIKGIKSELEKFAGADFTSTCETFIAENGRAIQACTSHQLGENFSKMFDIKYLNKEQKTSYVSQTSWGFTTRSIGIVIMIHSDNQGLVLPPKIASIQVVIVPIVKKGSDNEGILKMAENCYQILSEQNLRVKLDDRDHVKSGRKYNEWEMKGVPIRLEIGEKELKEQKLKMVRRCDNNKSEIECKNLLNVINEEFENISKIMYENAEKKIYSKIVKSENWELFMKELNKKQIVQTPWCENEKCEEQVKAKSKEQSEQLEGEEESLSGSAKTLCKPLKQEKLEENQKCFNCGEKAKTWVLWGRSY